MQDDIPLLHPLAPIWDRRSRLLILGSFPSVLSRRQAFYYGNPRNRFWQVLSLVYQDAVPEDSEGRRQWLLERGIALWDVLHSCAIRGSSDASIRQAQVNDLSPLLAGSRIGRIFLNGGTAARYFAGHIGPTVSVPSTVLPSTSPANAAWSLERLADAWMALRAQAPQAAARQAQENRRRTGH